MKGFWAVTDDETGYGSDEIAAQALIRTPGRKFQSRVYVAWAWLVLTPLIGRAAEPLSLVISTSRTVVTAGDDIEIQAVVKNTSEDPVPIGFTDDPRFDFRVEVIAESGIAAPESKAAQRRRDSLPHVGPSHYRTDDLPPGRENRESFDLPDFFDLSSPGAYSVQVLALHAGPLLPRSNVLTITVEAAPPPDHVVNTAAMLAAAEAAHARSADSKLASLRIEADQSVVSAGKPLAIFYELTNLSSQTIRFAPGSAPPEFVVEARDEKGALVPDRDPQTALKDRMSRGEEGDPELAKARGPKATDSAAPGGRMTGGIDPTRFVDLSAPGTYTIQIWRKLPKEVGGEIHSNVLLMTVKPAAAVPASQ